MFLRTRAFWVNHYEFKSGDGIEPGNWGRIIRERGEKHPHFKREQDMEAYRAEHYPNKPSRLECCYVCQNIEDALWYRRTYCPKDRLYEVRFDSETIPYHQGFIMCLPPLREKTYEEAIKHYWDFDLRVEPDNQPGLYPVEVLTLSPLLIVEELDPSAA